VEGITARFGFSIFLPQTRRLTQGPHAPGRAQTRARLLKSATAKMFAVGGKRIMQAQDNIATGQLLDENYSVVGTIAREKLKKQMMNEKKD